MADKRDASQSLFGGCCGPLDNALCGNSCQYIAASYVKYLEMAGARVVPIDFFSTPAQIDSLFDSLNGVLFPGGGSPFPETAQYVFDKVVAANDAGDYFPLWGTCMGAATHF